MIATIHINRPAGKYHARVRLPGHRKYQSVGKPTHNYHDALKRLAKAFAGGQYKRGDVLWVPNNGYYEPHRVCEIVKD